MPGAGEHVAARKLKRWAVPTLQLGISPVAGPRGLKPAALCEGSPGKGTVWSWLGIGPAGGGWPPRILHGQTNERVAFLQSQDRAG